jgi:hypothetical protein
LISIQKDAAEQSFREKQQSRILALIEIFAFVGQIAIPSSGTLEATGLFRQLSLSSGRTAGSHSVFPV